MNSVDDLDETLYEQLLDYESAVANVALRFEDQSSERVRKTLCREDGLLRYWGYVYCIVIDLFGSDPLDFERCSCQSAMLINSRPTDNIGYRSTFSADRFPWTACERLGCLQFDHRAFCRMLITNTIEKGIDVKVIAEWQGHVDGGKPILDTTATSAAPTTTKWRSCWGDNESLDDTSE